MAPEPRPHRPISFHRCPAQITHELPLRIVIQFVRLDGLVVFLSATTDNATVWWVIVRVITPPVFTTAHIFADVVPVQTLVQGSNFAGVVGVAMGKEDHPSVFFAGQLAGSTCEKR